jgi:hypothetical protein
MLRRKDDRQPKEGLVADKSSQLILAALSRAAAADDVPLHGNKTTPGLFPATAAGKQAAQRCQEEGWLATDSPAPSNPDAEHASSSDSPAATATLVKKKMAVPRCRITDKGLTYLLAQVSPRQVLEDFVRVLEARQAQADELLACVRDTRQSLDALRANAEKVLHQAHVPSGNLKALFQGFLQDSAPPVPTPTRPDALTEVLLAELARWQKSGASEDCPLPHLFRQVRSAARPTIGAFHDALRRLHDDEQIYLHPWTGPLYEVPEPSYALLVGHEVAYYASRR